MAACIVSYLILTTNVCVAGFSIDDWKADSGLAALISTVLDPDCLLIQWGPFPYEYLHQIDKPLISFDIRGANHFLPLSSKCQTVLANSEETSVEKIWDSFRGPKNLVRVCFDEPCGPIDAVAKGFKGGEILISRTSQGKSALELRNHPPVISSFFKRGLIESRRDVQRRNLWSHFTRTPQEFGLIRGARPILATL